MTQKPPGGWAKYPENLPTCVKCATRMAEEAETWNYQCPNCGWRLPAREWMRTYLGPMGIPPSALGWPPDSQGH